MAQVFAYTKPNKLYLLHEQLIAAGITPLLVEGQGDNIRLTVQDGQAKPPVDAVVAAHDPTVLSVVEVAAAQADADRTDLNNQFQVAAARLDDIITNGAAFTAAQVRDAVVDEARILRRVLRLMRSARV